ncbi:putative oxidoreductase [Gordonia polyisoprenivorans VH2]|uniref:Putative oxidoreductase n=1 Tax=Gordonia polyisoprenivorans (strain DSM 44266 / VH2) TaxID=1112204 RepID=H6MZ99_GORPV|nr:SDR family oxidoreductase [Gordonia polyisoprenivorans]AFA75641.1 putative oxidoreductase [Gordonia polyisoprenivorans VH2]OZC32674.1 3-beta hydroxysteroid dehydrogenase [Gordonia polyisoprenivorans]UZF56096.1 SDR family oxidoreductase [Gordonia polyisoprenivorans]
MRVFITGASGHVASALIPELVSAGHQVAGLARSDEAAEVVAARGAQVVRGDLSDLDVLRGAAAAADGVVHLAFRHDLMQVGDMAGAADADLAAVNAIADELTGTGKALVGTSGTAMLALMGITGRPGLESDAFDGGPRIDTENLIIGLADKGVRSSIVRLPPTVHSDLDHHGFVPGLIGFARQNGAAGYLGDGANRWPAVHTRDAARLYRLAVESAPAGTRLHAVADDGVPFRDIAAAIGRGLDLPVKSVGADDAPQMFGYLAGFVGVDNPTSSSATRALLSWEPTEPGLLEDLGQPHYFA